MKRFAIQLLALMIITPAFSQVEHLKFMGIPLDGSISTFQSKLTAKGINYDAYASKILPKGCRAFKGVFSGEKASIYVYYNEKTKTVYRAKAVIEYMSKERGEYKLRDFSSMLQDKYGSDLVSEGEQNDHPSFLLGVSDNEGINMIGLISLYISDPEYSFMENCFLHVDYEDKANSLSDKKSNMDDL